MGIFDYEEDYSTTYTLAEELGIDHSTVVEYAEDLTYSPPLVHHVRHKLFPDRTTGHVYSYYVLSEKAARILRENLDDTV